MSRTVAALSLSLVTAAPALAQSATGHNYAAGLDKRGSLTLRETVSKRDLVAGGNQPVAYGGQIKPTIAMKLAAGGADFTVRYTNTTTAPAKLGTIGLTGVRFAAPLRYWQFGQDTKTIDLKSFDAAALTSYPGGTYSPVQVISDGVHTLGVSLLYPAAEYDHTVQRFTVGSERVKGNPGAPRTWAVGYRLDGELPPGATRTYTLAVRAVPASASWLETVVPYRDYFQATYGPVKYQRDDRPVLGLAAAFVQNASPSNPRGWAEPTLRPDQHGWGKWAAKIRADAKRGSYDRVMLWTPSGVFDKGPANFPFQFMSTVAGVPKAAESVHELAALSAHGGGHAAGALELGFWWGHSANVMTTWNPTSSHALRPSNADDAKRGFAELDSAVAAGATMIGLDAFQMSRPADLYHWLKMMQARHPHVRFVSENAASDLIHNLAPTFHEASVIVNPHVMGDFLNPGHETWAAVTTWGLNVPRNRAPTPAERDAEINRLRGLGFVPLTYGVVPQPKSPVDTRSWLRSVPVALRANPPAVKGPALPAKLAELARMSDQSVLGPSSAAPAAPPARAQAHAAAANRLRAGTVLAPARRQPETRDGVPVVLTSADR